MREFQQVVGGLARALLLVLGSYVLACAIGLLLGNESLCYAFELWWSRCAF